METPNLPPQKWAELKKELTSHWQELTDTDLEETQGRSESLVELLEHKLGMTIDNARAQIAEMVSHCYLYNKPEDTKTLEEQKRSIGELYESTYRKK